MKKMFLGLVILLSGGGLFAMSEQERQDFWATKDKISNTKLDELREQRKEVLDIYNTFLVNLITQRKVIVEQGGGRHCHDYLDNVQNANKISDTLHQTLKLINSRIRKLKS